MSSPFQHGGELSPVCRCISILVNYICRRIRRKFVTFIDSSAKFKKILVVEKKPRGSSALIRRAKKKRERNR